MHYENLPQEIQEELDTAIMKVHEVTPAIRRAIPVITRLLDMAEHHPAELEEWLAYVYQRMDSEPSDTNYVDTEEIEIYPPYSFTNLEEE